MPDIEFVNSPKTEQDRLQMTAKVIAQGFYARHGFVVMPTLDARVDPNATVVYPLKHVYTPIDPRQWIDEWRRVGETFWAALEQFLPGTSVLWSGLEVRLTRYGTVSSSARSGIKAGERAIFYLRHDVDISHLPAMIINQVLDAQRQALGITWTKREALMDFIMTRPPLRSLFPHFRPVMSQLSRVPSRVRQESAAYVHSLGFLTAEPELLLRQGKIVVRGNIVGKELSKKERVVCKLLLERQGDLVTYDELADTVWGVGEFKTFWALNKVVERLRTKLTALGIVGAKLESVRGQGYLLLH